METLAAVSLPQASFRSGVSDHAATFDFQQLAQTLLQIGGDVGGERREKRAPASSRATPSRAARAATAHTTTTPTPAPAAAAQQALPVGMQLLCSAAWDSVYSPPPPRRQAAASAHLSSTRTPIASPPASAHKSSHLQSPLPSTSAPSRASPPVSSPNRFSADLSEEEDEEEDDVDDKSHVDSSFDDDDTLHTRPERMHAYEPRLSSVHASLADLARATEQFEWGGPATRAPLSTSTTTGPFHDTSTFSTTSLHEPFVPVKRAAPFHMEQPVDSPFDDEEEQEEQEEQDVSQPASLSSLAAVSSTQRSLDLEYDHLQQSLHHLQMHYSEQLAVDVRRRMQELDVALALAVGLEPDEATLEQLTHDRDTTNTTMMSGSSTSQTNTSSTSSSAPTLLDRSRAYAKQHQLRTLSQTLAAAHTSRLTSLQSQLRQLQQSQSAQQSLMRQKLTEAEAAVRATFANNHEVLVKRRDEAVRVAEEKHRVEEAAAAAERKRVADAIKAKEAAEAAEKAAAEKKAAEEAAAAAAALAEEQKAKEEAANKAAADKAAADAVAKPAAVVSAAPAASPAVSSGAAPSGAAVQEMAQRTSNLAACRASKASFLAQPSSKQRRMQLTMFINREVSQIVGTVSQVQSKAQALLSLLKQSQTSSPAEYALCLDMLATKLVSFTKSKVRLQNSAAFPLAMVALYIALEHSQFTDIFLASLAEKCIYITPTYLERKAYPSMHAYMLALGYEEQPVDESKQVEGQPAPAPTFDTEEQYFERMVGYVCMYAAFVEKNAASHPHGIEHAWTWLARVLNQKPRSATASILRAFLSTAGCSLFARYPTQFRKVLDFMYNDYVMRLDATTPPRKAAQAVLALWLQTNLHAIQQFGQMPEPEGRNMPTAQESDASQQEVYHDDQ